MTPRSFKCVSASLVVILLSIGTLFGDISIVVEQNDDGVIARFSGTLDIDSYSTYPHEDSSYFSPRSSGITFAPISGSGDNSVMFVVGDVVSSSPLNFGPGFPSYKGIHQGDFFQITETQVHFPFDYNTGDPLSGSLTFAGETFGSLGVHAPGEGIFPQPYIWELTGGDRVTMTTQIVYPAQEAEIRRLIRKLKKKIRKKKKKGKRAKARGLKRRLRALNVELIRLESLHKA